MGSNAASSGSSDRPMTVRSVVAPKKKNPIVEFVKGGGIAGAVIRGVSGAIQKSKTDKALQGTSDYQGSKTKSSVNSFGGGNGGNGINNNNSNAVVPLTTAAAMSPTTAAAMSPTTAEVSQATATDATNTNLAEDAALRKKKAKATGRSMTILTSSKGVNSDQGLILGKKSLLGA